MRSHLVWLMCAAAAVCASCGRSRRPPPASAAVAPAVERPHAEPSDESDAPFGRSVTIAARTPLSVRLEQTIALETGYGDEAVVARVVAPVIVEGLKAIPSGCRLVGEVTLVRAGTRASGRGEVGVRFTRLVVKTESYPIRTALVVPGAAAQGRRSIALTAGAVLKTELLDAVTVRVPIRPLAAPSA